MLPTVRRVKKQDFPQVMRSNLVFYGKNINLKVFDRKDEKPTKFSFVVSSKIQKSAVKRHIIKRRLSSVIENRVNSYKKGMSLVFLATKDLSEAPYGDISTEIEELSIKTKTLK
jgi:ribonuclease P protein component